MKVAVITGDARQMVDAVGTDLGIDEVFADVLPQDKDSKVAEPQAPGLKVALVGDGVNDARPSPAPRWASRLDRARTSPWNRRASSWPAMTSARCWR